ncbi:hypothetical protein ElyMa_002549400 [Elysia marginata]|uniref:Uncharacterized protein n=1 Tax=Elysia marginata TaxID=1093978 RepID=A0AAV4GZH1_9GAST|nr:hypothetical protein ElyMa_002549400 [Elysia marginata]
MREGQDHQNLFLLTLGGPLVQPEGNRARIDRREIFISHRSGKSWFGQFSAGGQCGAGMSHTISIAGYWGTDRQIADAVTVELADGKTTGRLSLDHQNLALSPGLHRT